MTISYKCYTRAQVLGNTIIAGRGLKKRETSQGLETARKLWFDIVVRKGSNDASIGYRVSADTKSDTLSHTMVTFHDSHRFYQRMLCFRADFSHFHFVAS